MSVLVLRLAGPMQSWGSASRFLARRTEEAPTKSGIVGLLAAACGRRRSDPIEDLVDLRFAARIDQTGELLRDFQTARRLDGKAMPLSYRYYLTDAVFTAYVEGSDDVIGGLADAVRNPTYPLYLGRRSCPPAGRLFLRVRSGGIPDACREEPWQVRPGLRRNKPLRVQLSVLADEGVFEDARPSRTYRDLPVSFDPANRQYGWRSVAETSVTVANPDSEMRPAPTVSDGVVDHDPFGPLGG